jgi:hypothetical protein
VSAQVEVLFNGGKYEVDIKPDHLDAVKQLLEANKNVLSYNKSILLELENSKLCSNGFMTVTGSSRTLQAFFETLAPYLVTSTLTIDIIESESKEGLLLRYKSGKLEKKETYSA